MSPVSHGFPAIGPFLKNIEEKQGELPIRNWVLWQRTGFLLAFELDRSSVSG